MKENTNRINILAWLALLLFVFSCGSEAEKEQRKLQKEKETIIEDSVQQKEKLDSLEKEIKEIEKTKVNGVFTDLEKFKTHFDLRHEKIALERGITKEELIRENKQLYDELRLLADSLARTSISIEEIKEKAMKGFLPLGMPALVAKKRAEDSINRSFQIK